MHDYTMFRPHENEDNESSTFSEKIIDHYKLRPVTQESTTLKEFASKYSLKGGRLVTHQAKNLRIVISVPKVEFGKCDETDEIYCKQMLLLNIPWRSFDELKTEDTWKKSYKSRQLNIWQLQINDDNGNEDDVVEREDVTEEQTEWMNLAEALPHQVPRETDLGYRDIDRNYDWFSNYDLYPNIDENINFIQRSKGNSTNQNVRPSVEDDIILNIEQEAVVQYVMLQLENNELPRFSMVTGAAGTGKSSVIKKIVYEVEKSYGEESVLLLAPTGVAANNISGQTIHSALKLGASMKGTMELRGETERDFQNSLENTKVIVIDEFSMIGLTLLGAIDTRLRQANPEGSDLTLGGYIVYFFGDFNQLQPVCDYALYAEPRPNNALAVRGKELLMRMAIGEVTENDYKILSNRFDINNLEETSKFLNALRLKSTNDEIKIYNDSKLRELGKPVVIINALHNPPNQVAASASAEEANGLSPSLTLAKGCKVILRQNLWTAMGLCNGTLGEVFDIVYKRQDTESSHLDQLPLCVLVKFPTYKGPTIYDGLIPIPISKAVYKKRNITCTRQQFPLNLAFAISIHRSQGISCDKAVVDIGKTEHSQGLTYVACSRVRTIEGILFSPCFNIERFLKLNSNQEKKKM